MRTLDRRLKERGWKKVEIQKAVRIINKVKTPQKVRSHDRKIYWYALIMIILTITVSSFALIPFILTIVEPAVYIFVVVIAFTFGYLFQWIIGEIEVMELPRHLVLLMTIPVFSIVIFFFIVGYANYLQGILQITNPQNNILIGVIYSLSFLMPYFVREAVKVKGR